jgi:hypothetical protein
MERDYPQTYRLARYVQSNPDEKPPVKPSMIAAREFLAKDSGFQSTRNAIRAGSHDANPKIPNFLAGVKWARENPDKE